MLNIYILTHANRKSVKMTAIVLVDQQFVQSELMHSDQPKWLLMLQGEGSNPIMCWLLAYLK